MILDTTRNTYNKGGRIRQAALDSALAPLRQAVIGRVDDTVGNPHRAPIVQFELPELTLLLKLAKQLPVEQFEATVIISVNSTLPPPLPALCPHAAVYTCVMCYIHSKYMLCMLMFVVTVRLASVFVSYLPAL